MSAQARARLNSVEKVADWVASSPVVRVPIPSGRRNSSPPPKPKWELIGDSGVVLSGGCAIADDDDEVFGAMETRGRRRANELDRAPIAVGFGERVGGPGYGNGRSGLKGREVREEREGREGHRGRW